MLSESEKYPLGKGKDGLAQIIAGVRKELGHDIPLSSEGRVPDWRLTIGGKSSKKLQRELQQRDIRASLNAQYMLNSKDFITLKEPKEIELVRLRVSDLGFSSTATFDQICQTAQEQGYELCAPEVGVYLRLVYQDQPMGERLSIGMKPITTSYGNPRVFGLERDGNDLCLGSDVAAGPADQWYPKDVLVFSLRPSTKT